MIRKEEEAQYQLLRIRRYVRLKRENEYLKAQLKMMPLWILASLIFSIGIQFI